MRSFETIRSALEVRGKIQARGHELKAQCPAHDDRNPSLSVTWHREGKTLIRCHAGCQADDVIAALGLEFSDLFDEELPEPGNGIPVRSYRYDDWKGDPWIIKDRHYPKWFGLRLPGTQPGDRSGLKGRQPVLFRLPQLLAAQGKRVLYVEGEKDVETAEKLGEVATTQPYGAGATWHDAYTEAFRRAQPAEVLIVRDDDEKGLEHATTVRMALKGAGLNVRVVRTKAGKDLTDHVEAGHGIEDLLPESAVFTRAKGMDGNDLREMDFPPLRWAIPNLLPAGLSILAASAKRGKSWLALDMALAVACGGKAIGGQLPAGYGSVLYLAREDSYRRVQSRMYHLMAERATDLSKLEIIPGEVEWPSGEQGIGALEEWAEEAGDPMLVILDTLAKVEPQEEQGDRYKAEYAMMARYKRFADRHNCCVLVVHHDRKSKEDDGDVFTRISGTRGLTGAADTMMYLEKVRGEDTGNLHITGRDVSDQVLEMRMDRGRWIANGLLEKAYEPPTRLRVVKDE